MKNNSSQSNSKSEAILAVQKALNEAKTPTTDRYGYIIKEDGTVEKFGPITLDEFVPANKPIKGVRKIQSDEIK